MRETKSPRSDVFKAWQLVKHGVDFAFTLIFKSTVTFVSGAAVRFSNVILGSVFVKKHVYGYSSVACILTREQTDKTLRVSKCPVSVLQVLFPLREKALSLRS
jgi:hypothetical protein